MMLYSHSSLNLFETCPNQFEHTYIIKDIQRQDTDATIWGTKVHSELEEYALKGTPVVNEGICSQGVGIIDAVKGEYSTFFCEWEFGLSKDLRVVDFKSLEAFVRGIVDFGAVKGDKAFLADWKTGKPKDDFKQMEIFTLATFAAYPEVDKVKAAYIWLKTTTVSQQVFTRTDMPMLLDRLMERVRHADEHVEAGNFPMKPSGLCRGWCPVKSCPSYKEPRG